MTGRDARKISVSRETIINIGAKILQSVLGFGGIVLFTRLIGSTGLGKYRTVTATAFIILIFSRSFGGTIKKRISEIDTDASEYLTLALLIHGGLTVLTVCGLYIGRRWAINYLGSIELTIGVALIVGSLGFFHILTSFQAGIGYPAKSTWLDTLRSVLTLSAQVSLLLLGFQALGVVLGLGFATFVTAVIIFLSIRPSLSIPTVETAHRTFEYARYTIPTNFVSELYKSADPILIKSFSGVESVGFYTVASQLVTPGSLFSNSVSSALSVKSSGVNSAGGDLQDDLTNSLAYCGIISIPILFGCLALPNALLQMELFGNTYTDAPGGILIGMAVFQVLTTFQAPIEAVINGSDRPDIIFRSNVVVLVIYVTASAGLGYFYGALGVVAGTVISEIFRLSYYQAITIRWFDSIIFPKAVKDQLISGGVMFAVVEFASIKINTENMIPLISIVALGAVVYFSVLLTISSHFRNTITRTMVEFDIIN